MMNILWDAGLVVKGLTASEDFYAELTPLPIYVGGTSTPITISDSNVIQVTDATTNTGAQINVLNPSGIDIAIASTTPGIASVVGSQIVPVSSGQADVLISGVSGVRKYSAQVSVGASSTYNKVQSFVAGSLAKHIRDAILTMTGVLTASATTMELFSAANYDTSAPSATRNASLFAGLLDLSGITFSTLSASNGARNYFFPGTLLKDSQNSGRFVASASHVALSVGDTAVFMRTNGTFQTATILERYPVPGTDMSVSYLSAGITGCNAMQVLPDNWSSYLPVATLVGGQVPCLVKNSKLPDQGNDNRVSVSWLSTFAQGQTYSYGSSADEVPPTGHGGPGAVFTDAMAAFNSWRLPILSGSSGSPSFLPINGQPVLIGQQYGYNVISSYLGLVSGIESWISSKLGVAATLSRVSLAGFNIY